MASHTRHVRLVHDEEPIRLFQSGFLEFFTHIHPAVILVIWVPVVVYCLASAIVMEAPGGAGGWVRIPLGFLLGLFLWTLVEYTLHRFVFPFRPRTPWQERLSFLAHGIHHAQPKSKTRLVMPPVISIPLAVLFYGLFWLILGAALGAPHWIAPTFAGFLSGYVTYDMIHYVTHHIALRKGVGRFLKRYHMEHHYKAPNRHFGVSSPLWDRIFRTQEL